MKVYSVATKTIETVGHGQTSEELRICQEKRGWEGDGSFPPVFKTRQSAENYRNGIKYFKDEMQVVELELIEEESLMK